MANKYENIVRRLGGKFYSGSRNIAPFSEAQLDQYEIDLGYRLPADYREFLRDYGGISVLNYPSFPINDPYEHKRSKSEGSVTKFFGLWDVKEWSANTINTIELEDVPGMRQVLPMDEHATEVDDPPRELLPIAISGGGSQIYLALAGLRPGAIFYWENWADIYLVADSFDEFMHLIQPAKS